MKMQHWMGLFAGIFVLTMVSTAGATGMVAFDFEGENKGIKNQYKVSQDGLEVKIRAFKVKNDGAGDILKLKRLTGKNKGVYVGKSGLGVKSGKKDGADLDGGKSWTKDPDEGLLFRFKQEVELKHIDFGDFGKDDDFNLHVGKVPYLLDYRSDTPGVEDSTTRPGNILLDTITVETIAECGTDDYYFTGIFGKNFLIWADGPSDDFRIDGITVVRHPAPVPEPGTLLLLGAGLAGLGFYRRRQRK